MYETLTAECPRCGENTPYLGDAPYTDDPTLAFHCSPCFWARVKEHGYPTRISELIISGKAILVRQTIQ